MGPSLKHVGLHWQKVLFDDDCTVVAIIDWEWANTVPMESCQPLHFNSADYRIPRDPAVVASFEDRVWSLFRDWKSEQALAWEDQLVTLKAL